MLRPLALFTLVGALLAGCEEKMPVEKVALAEDKEFAQYLRLRAEAFTSDNYQPSDMAWMDTKNNPIDVVIGPIENMRTSCLITAPRSRVMCC